MTVLLPFAASLSALTAALIVNSTGHLNNRWAYRAVLSSQYGFAAIPVVLVWFMPEYETLKDLPQLATDRIHRSPWWFLSKERDDLALKSLQRLGYGSSRGKDLEQLASIKITLERIRHETDGVSYRECFRKSNLRRTIVAISPLW